MFCPNDECPDFVDTGLRAEYREDVFECPFCGTRMVAQRPPDHPTLDGESPGKPRVADDETMEPVMESADLTEIAVVKSVLDGAGIPYIAHGEERFGAFRGAFISGSIFNPRSRGVTFTVPSRMAEAARALLEELEETETSD
jgi:hypothetical protein